MKTVLHHNATNEESRAAGSSTAVLLYGETRNRALRRAPLPLAGSRKEKFPPFVHTYTLRRVSYHTYDEINYRPYRTCGRIAHRIPRVVREHTLSHG